jgi:hypothetical protein
MLFSIIEACISKLSLLSMVTPSDLNCSTTLIEIPTEIYISLRALTLLTLENNNFYFKITRKFEFNKRHFIILSYYFV